MFEYVHFDGRVGRGWSLWAAVVAALGRTEANVLPESWLDPAWNYAHSWGEEVVRVAPLRTTDGIDYGAIRELRS